MNVRFLGAHNSESQNTRLLSILIDDIFIFDAGCLTSELRFKEQEKIKAIFLSHGHYDHIRSIPSFAFNNYLKTTNIYASKETHDILSTHLIDGVIYPKFNEKISFLEQQPIKQVNINAYEKINIEGYKIIPYPMNHIKGSFGFEITSKENKTIFFTGDTGLGLTSIWKKVSPDILIIDLTFPNKLKHFAKDAQHLCPEFLHKELLVFKKIHHYLPRIKLIHISPRYKEEIREEIKKISDELDHYIEFAVEGGNVII